MSRELISIDPATGVRTWLEFDEVNPRKFHIHHDQDVEAIIEHNKVLQNDADYKKHGIKNEFHHVAHIPDIVVMQWLQEGIDVMRKEHWPAVRRKLLDPMYRHLRTTLGTQGRL